MTGEKLVRITRENLETGTVARLVAERGDEDTQLATEDQLKAFRAAGRNDLGDNIIKRTNDGSVDEPGMMQTIAAEMSDTQIKAVASFISGLSK